MYSDEFSSIWKLHPKGPKKKALDEYERVVGNGIDHAHMLGALGRYVRMFKGDFTGAHLFRWIKDKRWEEQADSKELGALKRDNVQNWSPPT